MEFHVNNIHNEIGLAFTELDSEIESDFLNSIKADISIHYGDNIIDFVNVELLKFYVDLKDSFSEVIVREVKSSIRLQYEEILNLVPDNDGCLVITPQVPYPADNLNHCGVHVSISVIRKIFKYLESVISDVCKIYRNEIILLFEQTQSPELFVILRAIDGAAYIQVE